jgi:hypothetical protein
MGNVLSRRTTSLCVNREYFAELSFIKRTDRARCFRIDVSGCLAEQRTVSGAVIVLVDEGPEAHIEVVQ